MGYQCDRQIEQLVERRGLAGPDLIIAALVAVLLGAVGLFFYLMVNRPSTAITMMPMTLNAGASETVAGQLPKGTERVVEPFTLTDQAGEVFASGALDGKYWIANFIFTNCAGPCPIMTGALSSIQDDYADEADLRFVSISVDPTKDTPARLTEFGTSFGADFSRWSFLTGEYEVIQHLARDVFLLALENPGAVVAAGEELAGAERRHSGAIVHSSRFILVGPDRKIIDWYAGTEAAGQAKLREILDAIFGKRSVDGAGESGG